MNHHGTLPLISFIVGGILGAAGTGLMRRLSIALNFVDRPGGHKAHAAPVALGGGVAVTLAIITPILVGISLANLWSTSPPTWLPSQVRIHIGGIASKTPLAAAIAASAIAICAMGLIDDIRGLSARLRLIVQIIVAAFLVYTFNLRLLSHLGPLLSGILSVLWIVTLINALNFLDNMDGLSSGVAAIASAVFGVAASRDGQVFVPVCCWLLTGALVGFLPFNFYPAKVFLGDAGSTVVGLLLAVFTILTTFTEPAHGGRPIGAIAPLIVMAVPLYDTLSVIYIRYRSGAKIWAGDRRHFSHRLVRRGMSIPQAVIVIWLATLVTAMPALLLPTATWPLAWGILLETLCVVAMVALLESAGKRDESKP